MAVERTNPKDLIGAKKAPLALVPPALVIATSEAMAVGAKKYGPYNWRTQPVKMSIYIEAALRHLAAFFDGENFAKDSHVSHISHAAACMAILLDGMALGNIIDDRPTPGPATTLLDILDNSVPKEDPAQRPRPGEEVGRGESIPFDVPRNMTATEYAEQMLRHRDWHDGLPWDVISERADRRFIDGDITDPGFRDPGEYPHE